MTNRYNKHDENLKVLATACALTGATLVLPRRYGRMAGLALGAYLLRRQGLTIQATDEQAQAAALRGLGHWTRLTAQVEALEDLLAAAEPGGLHPHDVDQIRAGVIHRAVARRDPFRRAREIADAARQPRLWDGHDPTLGNHGL